VTVSLPTRPGGSRSRRSARRRRTRHWPAPGPEQAQLVRGIRAAHLERNLFSDRRPEPVSLGAIRFLGAGTRSTRARGRDLALLRGVPARNRGRVAVGRAPPHHSRPPSALGVRMRSGAPAPARRSVARCWAALRLARGRPHRLFAFLRSPYSGLPRGGPASKGQAAWRDRCSGRIGRKLLDCSVRHFVPDGLARNRRRFAAADLARAMLRAAWRLDRPPPRRPPGSISARRRPWNGRCASS
jgi:hypothetical protein